MSVFCHKKIILNYSKYDSKNFERKILFSILIFFLILHTITLMNSGKSTI